VTDLDPEALPRAAALVARLCAIPSPSRHEGEVAEVVRSLMRDLGAEITEDDAATAIPAGCGNIVARFPATAPGTPICTHLDTVPNRGPIDVIVRDGHLTNANDDILGGDNKAAVGAVIEAMRRVVEGDVPHAGVELVFTPCEEIGLRGAAHLDPAMLTAAMVFVFDHTGPLGGIVTRAPTLQKIHARFVGRTAHAGIRPEAGRSAVVAAARAVSRMSLGRLDDITTSNVGTIDGGTATNVVAEECTVTAEARSQDESRLAQHVMTMLDALTWAATEAEVDLETRVVTEFSGYRIPSTDPALALAGRALEACGLTPETISTGGGADTNAFIKRGMTSVNLCNEMIDVHTGSERIAIDSIERTVDVALAIIDAARGTES